MLKKILLYPFFFAIFPVLSLASYNIGQIFIGEAGRPLLFSILLASLVSGVAYFFTRNQHRAALTAVILLVLFFSYGQIYSAIEGRTVFGISLFRHRVLFPLFLILGFIAVIWIGRRVRQTQSFTHALNLASAFLLIYPSVTIAAALIRQSISDSSSRGDAAAVQTGGSAGDTPDVYYIILDGYGRQDVLQNEFGYDDSRFIDGLRARGFYVAECSQSNYAHTLYSLSSSLNYDYLEALGAADDSERITLLKHGAVRAEFESRGYSIVAFPTGWSMTEWTDADIYPDYGRSFATLTEFETIFLDTTMLRVATDYERLTSETTPYSNARRLRLLSMIETLKEIPSREGRYFVFAHFVIPHPPYSFGADGEWLEINVNSAPYEEISRAYLNQVEYISREILGIVDAIQRGSDVPPVIIIQADHGPPPDLTNDPAIKMPILNAYALPGVDPDQALYPSISPVNSFRVVLNRYFGADLPLLEDRSYFAPNQDHARIGLFPNSCP
jgi:hypothetical protein